MSYVSTVRSWLLLVPCLIHPRACPYVSQKVVGLAQTVIWLQHLYPKYSSGLFLSQMLTAFMFAGLDSVLAGIIGNDGCVV